MSRPHSDRNGDPSGNPYDRTNALGIVKERAAAAGVMGRMVHYTFCAMGITRFVKNDCSLDEAQTIANHANGSAKRLYGRWSKAEIVQAMQKVVCE